jgi:GGDEF domain-containing protein
LRLRFGFPVLLPMNSAERLLSGPVANRNMGRIAAAVWAAIALCGAIATIPPLDIPGSDMTLMRQLAAASALCAGLSFVLPWSRLPHVAFSLGLLVMSALIAGLAYAAGSADSGLTILFTFVVALAASFMPVRTSVAQLGVIAGLLVFLVLVVGHSDGARVEVFKVALLLATLTVLCGLVLIMRTTLDQLALGIRGSGSQRFRSVLLEAREFEAALNTELSRAGRHDRPLSVMLLEVVGSAEQAQGRQRRNAIAGVARSIVERIRIEDTVGHFGDMRFGVIAPETTSVGVAAMANTVSAVVRERLLVAGFARDSFDVAVGWAEFPHRATSREGLMGAAQDALQASKRQGTQPDEQDGLPAAPAPGSPGPQSA